jgi:hypothetical protein
MSYDIIESMSIDNPEDFSLKEHLKFIENEMRINDIMEPRGYIPPSQYDVLLSDVKHNDLVGNIAERLRVKYLEESKSINEMKMVEGILYGTNCRPMVNLVVSSKKFKKNINIIFLVDTGSPCLFVCKKAMEALGFSEKMENIPATFELVFRNTVHETVMSPLRDSNGREGHYHDNNLIGATFLSKTRAKLNIDYGDNAFSLTFE